MSKSSPAPMSQAEFARLDFLERRIKDSWDVAALALAEIKDSKLYRRTRDSKPQTWQQYCKRVHAFTPQWANKIIRRARTLQRIKAKSETEVSLSPTAVGNLEGLELDEQVEIVQEAAKQGRKPKARDIADKKYKKLMNRFNPGGDMHKGGDLKKPTLPTHYKLTVMTPDKDDLARFGRLLPDPITDFNAHSVFGWIRLDNIDSTLANVGKALGTTQPKKLRIIVEL